MKYIYPIVFICLIIACTSDKLPEPVQSGNCDETTIKYSLEIKPIIDTYCAIPACHVSNSDAPGNFSNYESMEPWLNADGIERYCIDLKKDGNLGMPPNWTTNAGPHDFTDEDFEKIKCWVELNYPN